MNDSKEKYGKQKINEKSEERVLKGTKTRVVSERKERL